MKRSIQSILMETVRGQMSPSKILAAFVVKSAKDQGVGDLQPHLPQVEDAISKWMLKGESDRDSLSFSIDGKSVASKQISLDAAKIDQYLDACLKALEKTIPEVTKEAAVSILKAIKKSARNGELQIRRIEQEDFRSRLPHYWGKAFDLLLLEIELARECGEWSAKRLLSRRRRHHAPLLEVTFLLHARACQVAGEVSALLESGYGSGAFARWRTLHEIAVISDFLVKHGDSAAQLYLDHVNVDSWRTASHFKNKGGRGISKHAMNELNRVAAQLEAKYGKAFLAEYGWAAVVLKKNGASFVDIERSVELDNARLIYRLASNSVHAGPKGALYKLGLLDGWEPVLLAGPSNMGLAEAGGYTAYSLMGITANLLNLRTNADSVVWMQVMLALAQDVRTAFDHAQKQIVKDEKAAPSKFRNSQFRSGRRA